MNHYIILCNRHLSIYGETVALFWGSDYGKSKGCYSSDIRHVYLYDETEIKNNSDVLINISDLGMTKDDFDNIRKQKFPHYLVKEFIVKCGYKNHDVRKFEMIEQDKKDMEEKYGYCAMNGGRCQGLDCNVYDIEHEDEWLDCDDRVSL